MSLDFSKWISKYDAVPPDEKIEYRDSSGNLKEEKDWGQSLKRYNSVATFCVRNSVKSDDGKRVAGLTTTSKRITRRS